MTAPLCATATEAQRIAHYATVRAVVDGLLEDPIDWVAAMATVACELHHAFAYFDWTGFYRVTEPELLVIGPYQGGHGCLKIPFSRGVCGAAARTREPQRVADVEAFPGHIACSSTTRSELELPILSRDRATIAVLDVDSNAPNAFTSADQAALVSLCDMLGQRFGPE